MQRHRVWVHSLDVWLLQPTRAARNQRNHRLRFEQELLGLGQKLVTLLMIDRAIGFVEQGGVFRIPPARSIVSPRRVEQTKKRERVHVICRPAGTRDTLVIQLVLRRKKR